MTMTTDFYHMRLVITITPTEIVERFERRQRARPAIPWADYRAIRSRVRGGA
jgi:hypothetical protein